MATEAAEFVCVATGTPYSRRVSAWLQRIVDEMDARDTLARPAARPGLHRAGRWFCPADGRLLTVTRNQPECGECGRTLPASLVYELVELNPHAE